MIVELRAKAQVTIPNEIVKRLDLSTGDRLEIAENDGIITIMPVAVYSKKLIDELSEEIDDLKSRINSGEQAAFTNLESLFERLRKP
ncbi:MAG: AbrB/MazE/SpoVT family DNA-binding domain-containing protein [Symbiobacteriaceae bacterium]|nr:AbrB/MazE/SpoVT family DNA-binding domain-containing protein [Symbiobacteriaceae bacterium]